MEYDYVDLRGQWAGASVSVTYWGAGTLNCYLIPSDKYADLVGGKEIDCDEFSVTQGTSVVQLPGPGYLILDGIGDAHVAVRPGVSASDYVSVGLHHDPGYDLNVGGGAPRLNQLPFTAPSGPYDVGERDLTKPFNPDFQYVDSSPLISQLNAMNAAAAAGPQQDVEQLATRYAQLRSQLDEEGNKSERERSQTSGGSLSASMLRPQLQEVQHQLDAAIAKLAAIPDYSSGQIGSLTVRKGGDPSKQVSFDYTDADGRRGGAEIRTLPDGRLSVIDGGRESTYKDGNFQGTTEISGTEAPGTFFEMSRAELIGNIAATMIPIPGTGWVLKFLGKAGERALPWMRKIFKAPKIDPLPAGGKWVPVNESMSDFSRAYQQFVTNAPPNTAYEVAGVRFDGVLNGVLTEVKGHYSQFVDPKTGRFKDFWILSNEAKGKTLDQAFRQVNAAAGHPIQWIWAEPEAARAFQLWLRDKRITGIQVKVMPPPPGMR